jgi:thioredoxin 1
MNKAAKLIIVIVLVVAIAGVAMMKKTPKSTNTPVADVNKPSATTQENLPRLVDLGADKCIPCKMMAPILEELKTTYNGKLQVDFIDVWKNPDEAPKYKISVIPTQIFYDSTGKELFRHEGFFAKEDILAKWKECGVDLGGQK